MASVIDKLPEAERKKVVDALLAGSSLRKVASIAGVSHTQVAEYKRRVLAPALETARKINALQAVAQSPTDQIVNTATLTRAVVQADPLLSRIAKHQESVDSVLAVATEKKDARGVAALVSTDLKGLELHARLTGRLAESAGPQVNIAIVCPAGSQPQVSQDDGGVVLDIKAGR